MRDGGRLAAAIAVLGDMATRHKPAKLALKAWGDGARYAGAKDRAFVSGLTLDALRRRRSLAWRMRQDTDRAVVLAVTRFVWGWSLDRVAEAAADGHGPGAISAAERDCLTVDRGLDAAPAAVRGDYPDWLDASLERVFGAARAEEGEALAARAPVDVRVNTLKADTAQVMAALAPFHPQTLPLLATALRISPPDAADRAPPIEVAPEFEMGWFEVQDLGSQIAAACAGDIAGRQVLDLCAGGGGKTLALAAAMHGQGQLYAYDADARRLTDTVRRGQRAGVTNLQVRSPIHRDALAGLEGRMDLVFVDAPCSGSGTWRRHPDAKWRLTEAQLVRRTQEQDSVLADAATFARPGGRIVYVTCSLLAEENEDRIAAFLAANPTFSVEPAEGPGRAWRTQQGFLRMTPLRSGADGFFVAILRLAD